MKTVQEQWVKVTRKDGKIEYATITEGGYLLWGSGFVLKSLDAESIEPIEGYPPTVLKEGIVDLDANWYGQALCDVNRRWNGWAMPYISYESALTLFDQFNDDDCKLTYDKHYDAFVFTWDDDNSKSFCKHVTTHNGVKYYDFACEGLIFTFEERPFNQYGNAWGYHSKWSIEWAMKIRETMLTRFGIDDSAIVDSSWHNDSADSMTIELKNIQLQIWFPCEEFKHFALVLNPEGDSTQDNYFDCDSFDEVCEWIETHFSRLIVIDNGIDQTLNVKGVCLNLDWENTQTIDNKGFKTLTLTPQETNFLQVAVDTLLEQIEDEKGEHWGERFYIGKGLKKRLSNR